MLYFCNSAIENTYLIIKKAISNVYKLISGFNAQPYELHDASTNRPLICLIGPVSSYRATETDGPRDCKQ